MNTTASSSHGETQSDATIAAADAAQLQALGYTSKFDRSMTQLENFSLGFTYGMYAFFALCSFFFVMAKIPETKGMELEDMSMDTMSRHAKAA